MVILFSFKKFYFLTIFYSKQAMFRINMGHMTYVGLVFTFDEYFELMEFSCTMEFFLLFDASKHFFFMSKLI